MTSSLRSMDIDPIALNETVHASTGIKVKCVELVTKNEYCKNVDITLQDGSGIIMRILGNSLPSYVMASEAATIKYIATKTGIPVSRVLCLNLDASHALGVHMLLEKSHGVRLSTVFSRLTPSAQDSVVDQIARWSVELFQHRFDSIGSLYSSSAGEFYVGPIVRSSFYVDGRGDLPLDRGPFPTARAYFMACAQRELDCARTQFAQETSQIYQRNIEDARFTVERTMALLLHAIRRCKGLDDDDPALCQFSLSLENLDLSNIYVSPDEPSRIISLPSWHSVSTRPLWHCARLPPWLATTLSDDTEHSIDKIKLAGIFRKVVAKIEGQDSLFLQALDLEDTRQAIDDVCDYDAFTDGFLLLPTLESIIATLPGEEDMDGLQALLDPNTLEGRAARIALLTHGSSTLSLAMQGDLPISVEGKALGVMTPGLASGCDITRFVTTRCFMAPSRVVEWLRETYPKPIIDPAWLDACLAWISDELQLSDIDTQADDIISNVDTQLLNSDLSDSMLAGTGFPENIGIAENTRLEGDILVQIQGITDIGHSAFSLQNIQQTRLDRADLVGLEGEDGEDEGPIPKYPRGMLRLDLSDGTNFLRAIEYRSLPQLELGVTPLGFKMILKDVPIRQGIAFLEPSNVILKGHMVEELDAKREADFAQGLRMRLGRPELEQDEQNPPLPHPPHTNAVVSMSPDARRPPLREMREEELAPRDFASHTAREEIEPPTRRRVPAASASTVASASSTVVSPYFINPGSSSVTLSSSAELTSSRISPLPTHSGTLVNSTITAEDSFNFSDDIPFDDNFLQELDAAEQAAINTQQRNEPVLPDGQDTFSTSHSDVIVIDSEEDDKENLAPALPRRLRRRIDDSEVIVIE